MSTDTRKLAYLEVSESRASTLRDAVYRHLIDNGPNTADATADELGESPFSIRPRFSELRNDYWIYDSGMRRENPASGKQVAVWEAMSAELRAQVIAEIERDQQHADARHQIMRKIEVAAEKRLKDRLALADPLFT